MSEWVTGEVITAAKLNQKELFIGDTAPVSPTDGQLWYDTVNNVLKCYDAASASFKIVGPGVAADKVSAPTPTAGDYQTPSSVSASSTPPEELWFSQTLCDSTLDLYSGYYWRAGQNLTIAGRAVSKLGFYLRKSGSPTGAGYYRVRRLGTDEIILEASFDVSLLGTSLAWKELSFPSPKVIDETVRLLVEYPGGDSANHIEIGRYLADVVDGYFIVYKDAYIGVSGQDATIKIYEKISENFTIDDNLDTYWEPSPPNETGAWIQWDLTGTLIAGVSGLRVYWGLDAAYRPTDYDIDYSEDGSTWTELVHETTDPGAGWKEYSWNPVASMRYLRLQVNTHGASGTRVYEADYYQASIWRHGHFA